MNKSELDQCHHENRTDIPWLLNGTLSDSAAAVLLKHLEVCSDCKADFESHEHMRAATLGNEVTPLMPTTKVDDIFGVGRTGRSRSRRLPFRSQLIAASIAFLGLVIVLSFYLDRDGVEPNQLFETATSTGSSGDIDYVLQLRFEDGVTNPEKGRIVAQLVDVVRWTVSDSGTYEVHVKLTEPSLAVLKDYEERTAMVAGVQSAKFTALQLPVR